MTNNPFSRVSSNYASFRPVYPDELYEFLLRYVPDRSRAWDCGTGNGQVARALANYFQRVDATDISRKQITLGRDHKRIIYSIQPAEQTSFPDQCFDLITAGQAAHWFDHERFYHEVRRTARPGALLALFGYGLIQVNQEVNFYIQHLYERILGDYWDLRRIYVDDHYQGLPFPFPEIETPSLLYRDYWTSDRLLGYLSTWSACTRYKDVKGEDPLDQVRDAILNAWGDQEREVIFQIFIRAGIHSTDASN